MLLVYFYESFIFYKSHYIAILYCCRCLKSLLIKQYNRILIYFITKKNYDSKYLTQVGEPIGNDIPVGVSLPVVSSIVKRTILLES